MVMKLITQGDADTDGLDLGSLFLSQQLPDQRNQFWFLWSGVTWSGFGEG